MDAAGAAYQLGKLNGMISKYLEEQKAGNITPEQTLTLIENANNDITRWAISNR